MFVFGGGGGGGGGNLARFGFHVGNMKFSAQSEEWINIHVNYIYNFACVFLCI